MSCFHKIDDELHLRQIELDDAERLFAVIDTNRKAISPWMRWTCQVLDVDAMRDMIGQWLKQTAETGCMSLGIELDGKLVGAVFHLRPDMVNSQVEVGYWLAESARGRGVATRAVRSLLDITFDKLGFNRVNIRIAPTNEPSLALAARLGLVREGVTRQAWKVGDQYIDAIEFGVLAEEWKGGAL